MRKKIIILLVLISLAIILVFSSELTIVRPYNRYLFYLFSGLVYAAWVYAKKLSDTEDQPPQIIESVLSGVKIPNFRINYEYGTREFYLIQYARDMFMLIQVEYIKDEVEIEYLKYCFNCIKWYKLNPGTQYFLEKHGKDLINIEGIKNHSLKLKDMGATFQIATRKRFCAPLKLESGIQVSPALEYYDFLIEPYNETYFEINDKIIKSPYKVFFQSNIAFQIGALEFNTTILASPYFTELLTGEMKIK